MSEESYKAGSILVLESGEYSDFGIEAILVALKDCDMPELAKEWHVFKIEEGVKALKANRKVWLNIDVSSFVGWLIAQQHFAPVQHSSLHIGSYSTIEIGYFKFNTFDFDEDVIEAAKDADQ